MSNYKYDTHVHTAEVSRCGKVEAKTLIHLYKDAGYHGVVITDHYTREYFEGIIGSSWNDKVDQYLSGYRIAYEEGQKVGLNVVLGMELRFDENINEYLVYGFDLEFLYENPMLYAMNIKRFKSFVENTPLLIYQAHPFRITATPANPEYLHGVEIYNGNPRHNSHNQEAFNYATTYNLKMLSGSDFHQLQDLARGGILLPEAPTTSFQFANLLKNDKVLNSIST